MGTFESLPHEIRDIIILYAGDHVKESQLMAVNKNWYNIYLALAYTAPAIDLSSKPSKFYGIADSPFHPGQYTTSITFRSFSAEPGYTQSKLYRLMMHTPHVKEVKFHQIGNVEAQDWEYFYKVLKTANAWKLHCLPDDWKLKPLNDVADMTLIYSTYLKCAQHLKHTINSLRLMKEMMPTNMDLSFLNVLTALRSLNITKGFLKSVYDLDPLLQQVPMLEELEVDFKKTSFISDHDNGGIILNREYPSIKTLNFHSFVFQTDQQARIFYTNFTSLQKLRFIGIQNELTIKPEIAEKFFTMLSSLLDYDFYIHGTFIGKFDFINANCLQETHVCIQNYENMTDAVRVKKSKDVPDGMIDYYFSDNRDVAMRTLLDLGPNIQQIQLIDVATIYIEYYLDIILSNQHKDLHSIVFHSHITQPFVRTDYVFKSSIQNISFRHRRLSNNALRDLSALFTNLKVVHFKACQFDQSSNDNTINIIMPDTAIDQLWVSCGVIFHDLFQDKYPKRWDPDMLPLVSITLTEEGVERFYNTILDKGIPVVLETTRTHFHLLAKATPNYKAMTKIIKVYVKSVRELSLKLNNDRSKDILMMF